MRLRILAWIGVMGMLGLGAWALGAWGGVAGTVLALTLLARATHAREERFLRELGPLVAAPPGLTRSFQRVLEESSIPVGAGARALASAGISFQCFLGKRSWDAWIHCFESGTRGIFI